MAMSKNMFDQTSKEIISESVTRGADLLDLRCPGWFNRIDIETFSTYYADYDVLNQLYGTTDNGRTSLGIDCRESLESYGFAIDVTALDTEDAQDMYLLFDAIWLDVIYNRLHNDNFIKHNQECLQCG